MAATATVVLTLFAAASIVAGEVSPTPAGHAASDGLRRTVAATPSPPVAQSPTSEQQLELQQGINRIRAVVPVNAGTSGRYPAVNAQARLQPDLYAAAFAGELLTQDYRTGRNQLLAWVQSESAQSIEPLVVGLTPVELRPRMAVASVQDGSAGPSPVPSQGVWASLGRRGGFTRVLIQHVTEPVSWAGAVANGEITDPGVTGRQVDAQVTTYTTELGKPVVARSSVSMTLNFEGPPARAGYGIVAVITYTVAAMGG